MSRFTLPRDLYFGENAMEELKVLRGHERAFIVTGGSSMRKGGFLARLEDILKGAGLQTKLFEGVEPDPSVETVMRGAKAMQDYGPDVIVAIGGGSPIDAAKAMWVFYEYPKTKFEDIIDPFTMPKLRKKAIFVAIPSTSGSASEVTAFSVITDYSTKIKYPLADFEITPDIAVLDPSIAETMPRLLAANTGMDALTHAVEAYVASLQSDFTDPLALKAVSMLAEYLIDSCAGDKMARGKVHIAQCLAGMAFSNALLGIVHSLAHKTGAQYALPHGCCNAIVLPYAIQYNAKACMARYADIARAMGLPGATDKQRTNALIREIRSMNSLLGIPVSFRDAGVSQKLFDSTADFISDHAAEDPCTSSNPRPADANALKRILTCAYNGDSVTF